MLKLPLPLHLHLSLPTQPVLLLLVGAPVVRSNQRGWVPQVSYPYFSLLGTITSHHPTSHLEVCLHVILLPTWLEISPYWRSLHEWMPPLGLLSTSPVVVAPKPPEVASPIVDPSQLSETSSKATCWEVIYSPYQPPSL